MIGVFIDGYSEWLEGFEAFTPDNSGYELTKFKREDIFPELTLEQLERRNAAIRKAWSCDKRRQRQSVTQQASNRNNDPSVNAKRSVSLVRTHTSAPSQAPKRYQDCVLGHAKGRKMTETIYALAHGPEDNPTFFYCGKTSRTIEQRFKEHVADAANPECAKEALEYWRHLKEPVRIVDLGSTETGLYEADWVRTLIVEGHPLQNASAGNAKVAKKRTQSTFSVINREAMARTSSERRNRLHSEAQTLSKSEIVRQRIAGANPSAEELDELPWRSAPVELMPFKPLPKHPEEIDCQMLKWGDYLILVAMKPKKWAYFCKNTRTATSDSYKTNWRNAPKDFTRTDALNIICKDWPTFIWWPLSSSDPLR